MNAVGDDLPFVEPLRRDVLSELTAHFDDSVADLVEHGASLETATAEVLRRMGPPDELAHHISRAHQTNRRLLAAAGGGVISVAKAAFGALILAFVPVLAVGIIAFGIVVANPAQYLWTPVKVASLPVTLSLAAYLVGQSLPYRIALSAHRPIAWARQTAAAFCGIALAGFFWFVYRTEMPWWSVAPFALIPAWGMAGALTAGTGPWRLPAIRSRPVVTVMLATAALMSIGMVSSRPIADSWHVDEWQSGFVDASGLSVVGNLSRLDSYDLCCFHYTRFGTTSFVSSEATTSLSMYDQLTAEVWPATPDLAHINDKAEGPLASVPLRFGPWLPVGGAFSLELLGTSFIGSGDVRVGYHADIPLTLRRDWGPTWLVLVGTKDASRDVLRYSILGDEISFDGSVVEWLLAR